jgi:hypothetical protein
MIITHVIFLNRNKESMNLQERNNEEYEVDQWTTDKKKSEAVYSFPSNNKYVQRKHENQIHTTLNTENVETSANAGNNNSNIKKENYSDSINKQSYYSRKQNLSIKDNYDESSV